MQRFTQRPGQKSRGADISLYHFKPLSSAGLEESSSDHQIQWPPKQQVTGWGHSMIPSLAPGGSGSHGLSYIAGQGEGSLFRCKETEAKRQVVTSAELIAGLQMPG